MTYYDDETARAYQHGVSREDAERAGLDMRKFDLLDEEFKGGSIPAHLIIGFKPTPPYSCEYHSGGNKGARLRDMCKKLRGES